MNGYQEDLDMQKSYGSLSSDSSDRKNYSFAGVFIPSLAPAYPSITDELKKDVVILKTSLEIREDYIDKLSKAKDSLSSKLDHKLLQIEDLEKQIKRYQEFFNRTRETDQYERTELGKLPVGEIQ